MTAPNLPNAAADETLISEITIQPDGRVYVFGTSGQIVEILECLNPNDPKLRRLLEHTRRLGAIEPAEHAIPPKP